MTTDGGGDGPRRIGTLVADDGGSSVPVDPEALAEAAADAMDPAVRDFVVAGAGGSETVDENRAAFRQHRLVPRVGRDVTERDPSVELFGRRHRAPVLLAPVGAQGLLHPDGELATARAAAAAAVPMVLSTVASRSIEAVAEASDGPRWFQLYWVDDRSIVESLVDRAEATGSEVIVLTLDAPVPPWREATLERGQVSPDGVELANLVTDPVVAEHLDVDPSAAPERALARFQALRREHNATWADVETLVGLTDRPVLVKGILHPDDAERAVEAGADGVVVSNHGGRQVHGSIAAIDALPAVAEALDPEATVLFDSGIRRGADVLTALALGADATLLGRPYLYGLALAGAEGVRDVLENLIADFDLALGMTGHADVGSVGRETVVRRGDRPAGPD